MKMLAIMAIPLTQGTFALVDGKNYEHLMQWNWFLQKGRNTNYAHRNSKPRGRRISMHRQILGLHYHDGKLADHINYCGLDNREVNIRSCTRQQNQQNVRIRINNKSGYKGIYWHKQNKYWCARIRLNGTSLHLGCFNKKEDAAKAYDKKAVELFGEFAKTNF